MNPLLEGQFLARVSDCWLPKDCTVRRCDSVAGGGLVEIVGSLLAVVTFSPSLNLRRRLFAPTK